VCFSATCKLLSLHLEGKCAIASAEARAPPDYMTVSSAFLALPASVPAGRTSSFCDALCLQRLLSLDPVSAQAAGRLHLRLCICNYASCRGCSSFSRALLVLQASLPEGLQKLLFHVLWLNWVLCFLWHHIRTQTSHCEKGRQTQKITCAVLVFV